MYAIIDPLQPASLIGTLTDVPVTTNGNLLGGYYNYNVYYAPGEGHGLDGRCPLLISML